MAQAITKAGFEGLPSEEKVIIRTALAAVNTARSAESAQSIESVAFRNARLRSSGSNHIRDMLIANARQAGLENLVGPVGEEFEKRYDLIFRSSASALHTMLGHLVSEGRLPEAWFDQLAALFREDVVQVWDIERTKGGHADIRARLTFKSALGLMAYVILRLSALSADSRAVLQCPKCGAFKLIESTGGDRISRFCSTKCRVAFNVRSLRARERLIREGYREEAAAAAVEQAVERYPKATAKELTEKIIADRERGA